MIFYSGLFKPTGKVGMCLRRYTFDILKSARLAKSLKIEIENIYKTLMTKPVHKF